MLFFGFLCDRVPPRRLVAAAALLRAALLLGLSACAAAGVLKLPSLCLFGVCLGACEALHAPARGALVPRLVHRGGRHGGPQAVRRTNPGI